ncbi:GAP1 [Symbiodinium natans]|uniref:GAP1 protein n=1 Tax=Symbiodinium natans TaxID=878477 RepID=A0A812MLU0_9DINO|nr:GAP1 [Symbiodinium natans]
MGNTVCDDLLGQWSAEAHRKEVPKFLRMLKAWRDSGSYKQVMMLAGDVHEGGWTDLLLHNVEGDRRIRQLTTSPIANKQTRPHEALAVSLTRGVLSSLDVSETGSGWVSRHYDWTNCNNYALVTASVATAGMLKVRVLKAWGLKNQDMMSWMDSYVKVTLGSQTFQTAVFCEDGDPSNPEWNSEEFLFTVQPTDYYCRLQVCDEDSYMGQDLGSVKLAIHELDACSRTLAVSLGPNKGVLEIEASFHRGALREAEGEGAEGAEAEDCHSGPPAANLAEHRRSSQRSW